MLGHWYDHPYTCLLILPCLACSGLAQESAELVASRNMIGTAINLPDELTDENIVWRTDLPHNKHTYAQPVIAGDFLLVGMDGRELSKNDRYQHKTRAALHCYDVESGDIRWRMGMGPKGPWWASHGVCSTPYVEDDRVYLVSPVGQFLCLDLQGQADGNDGEFQDEATMLGVDALLPSDGDVIWAYNFVREHRIRAHDAHSSDPLIIGDLIIFATGHAAGVKPTPAWAKAKDRKNWKYNAAPNLIVLNKHDGSLVATDDLVIDEIYHGQWSSPALLSVDGDQQIVWGDGEGYLHGLRLPTDGSNSLEPLWRIDCVPSDMRAHPFPGHHGKKPIEGPSHVIGKPVVVGKRIFLATGRDHFYSGRSDDEATRGRMASPTVFRCLEVSGSSTPQVVWETPIIVTQSTASVLDDLVFITDSMGFVHCLDANTGERYWQHDTGDDVTCRSQYVADGKLYVGNDHREFLVLRAAKEPEVLFHFETERLTATPTAIDGKLILAEDRRITIYR